MTGHRSACTDTLGCLQHNLRCTYPDCLYGRAMRRAVDAKHAGGPDLTARVAALEATVKRLERVSVGYLCQACQGAGGHHRGRDQAWRPCETCEGKGH